MANLLQETLDALNVETIDEAVQIIDWVKVYIDIDNEKVKQCVVPPDSSYADIREFLNSIDEDYNNYCIRQVVFGTIMLTDGSWLEHSDYGWTHRGIPMF